jgi:hypothetical protein
MKGRRLTVMIAALVAIGASAGGAVADDPPLPPGVKLVPGSVAVAPAAAPGVFASLGIVLPPSSCVANPGQPQCPQFSLVVLSPNTGADSTGFGPIDPNAGPPPWVQNPSGDGPGRHLAATNFGGTICNVNGFPPTRVSYSSSQGIDYAAQGKGENWCDYGYGVTYMELIADLQRWNTADDKWYTLDERYTAGPRVGGLQGPIYPEFNCNHTDLREYRTYAIGFSEIDGVVYSGVDASSNEFTCPDSY